MKTPSNSVRDIKKFYTEELKSLYDSDEAESLVMMLLEHYFGIDKVKMALNRELRLSESEMLTIHFAVKELKKNRPIQYVMGCAEFCGLNFKVDESVLIPRPETEEMVNMIVNDCQYLKNKKIKIWDIGTGSGCIAISLAKAFPKSEVMACDFSDKALTVAMLNAQNNNVGNVFFIKDDILNPKNEEWSKGVDIIVSNPPYVRRSEKVEMRRNVLDYEPVAALFVTDSEPLVFYDKILDLGGKSLAATGSVWLEINERLGDETVSLCHEKGFSDTLLIKDFRGRNRFVKCQK